MVNNLPTMQETQVQPQGQEDPLEKGMATRSSILAWRIAWTEEPGGIQSVGSQRVGHDWVTNTRKGNMCKICLYAWNQHKSTTDILSDFLKSWSFCLAVPFGTANTTSSLIVAWESSPCSQDELYLDVPFLVSLGFCLLWFSLMTSLSYFIQTHLPPPWHQTQPIHQGSNTGSFPWPNPPHSVSFSFILPAATWCGSCSILKSCPTFCDPIGCRRFHFFLFCLPWSDGTRGLPRWFAIKNLPAVQATEENRFNPWVRKIPWRRAWLPTPVFLPGKSHGQRSLAGCSHRVAKIRIPLKWLSMHAQHDRTRCHDLSFL